MHAQQWNGPEAEPIEKLFAKEAHVIVVGANVGGAKAPVGLVLHLGHHVQHCVTRCLFMSQQQRSSPAGTTCATNWGCLRTMPGARSVAMNRQSKRGVA